MRANRYKQSFHILIALFVFTLFVTTVIPLSSATEAKNSNSAPGDNKEAILTFKCCAIIKKAFLTEAVKEYEQTTGKRLKVIGGGATLGIRATAAGDSDIGGTCRPALPDRFDEEKGVFLTQVAWDALAFITHPSNPVNNLTTEQIKAILLGTITNWKEVGGTDRQIIGVFRSQVPEHGGKYSGVGYMSRIMLFDDPHIDFTEKALFLRNSREVEKTVEKIEFTFGVSGKSSASKRKVKMIAVNGVAPTKNNISSGQYPFFRPLYLTSRGIPAGEVKQFIDWLLGRKGQEIVSGQGTVNLEEGKKLKAMFRFWKHKEFITNF